MRLQRFVFFAACWANVAAAAHVTLSNDALVLRFDAATAALVDVRTTQGIRLAGGATAPVDVLQDGSWQFSPRSGVNPLRVVRYREQTSSGLRRMVFDCSAPNWAVQLVCEMPERGSWFRRRARWRYTGSKPVVVEGVRFVLPNVRVGSPSNCTFTLPSLWPPGDIPFAELREGRVRWASASVSVPALVAVHNRRRHIGLAAPLFTTQEWSNLRVREAKDALRVEQFLRAIDKLRPGEEIDLGHEYVTVTNGQMIDAIRACGDLYRTAGFRPAPRPEWAYGASIYSLPPGGTQTSGSRDLGNFANFRRYILPRLQRLGFDIVWFLPTNPGGYAPTDYYAIRPRYGTFDDLRALCEDAHERGLRVFLDLIPHGPKKNSPLAREIMAKHADWVTRNRDGSLFYKWGCLACDYAHPQWQDYMAKVAAFYVKRCDIDGWRVDVAAGHRPNWAPYGNNRPSFSSPHGPLQLLHKARAAMSPMKSGAALLGETASWLFLTECNFIYDWSFEQACRALRAMPPTEWAPAIKTWLSRQQAALPEGACFGLTRMLENHDQWKAVWYWGPGHHRALLSLCALVPGVSFVFSDEDVGFGAHIQWLNDLRERLPEIARGRAIYAATRSTAPSVVAFTRALGEKFTAVAINFSANPVRTTVHLPIEKLRLPTDAEYAQRGLVAEDKSLRTLPPRPLRGWQQFSLKLAPYATRVITFRPVGQPSPLPPLPRIPQVERPIARLSVSTSPDGVVVDNRFYRLMLKDGLIRSLRVRDEDKSLLTRMNLVEGKQKVWPGHRLDFAQAARAKPELARTHNSVTVTFRGTIPRADSGALQWTARYRCGLSEPIEVEFEIDAPRSALPVCGELCIELQLANAEQWEVNTFAGNLEDEFAVTHPLGDMMRGWKYWHRSGLLWEASQLPPGLSSRTVCARVGKTWIDIGIPPFLEGVENACLRERDSRGNTGLTLCLALLDKKGGTRLDRPLRARFSLAFAGRPGSPSALRGPGWTFAAEGANDIFKNKYYTLVLSKSRGGGIFGLTTPGSHQPVITASNVYSDRGIYSTATTPDGRTVKDSGASSIDYETDAAFRREGDGLTVEFRSFLRSRYRPRNVANPRVEYRLRYWLDASPKVRVECAVRPLLSAKALSAFLAQTLRIPEAQAWRVGPGADFTDFKGRRGRRVWESVNQPLAPRGTIEVRLRDQRTVRFSNIVAPPHDVQNTFLLEAGENGAVVFFAFLSGKPVNVQPLWRTVKYAIEIGSP